MKALLMSFLSLALLMASLLIPSPVMALSSQVTQPQMHFGATTESVPASTQETDSKLQSAIGSVTDGGGQTEKKGNTQERDKDGAKIDQMTQGLMKENGT